MQSEAPSDRFLIEASDGQGISAFEEMLVMINDSFDNRLRANISAIETTLLVDCSVGRMTLDEFAAAQSQAVKRRIGEVSVR